MWPSNFNWYWWFSSKSNTLSFVGCEERRHHFRGSIPFHRKWINLCMAGGRKTSKLFPILPDRMLKLQLFQMVDLFQVCLCVIWTCTFLSGWFLIRKHSLPYKFIIMFIADFFWIACQRNKIFSWLCFLLGTWSGFWSQRWWCCLCN